MLSRRLILPLLLASGLGAPALAQSGEVNVYSARHYDTDRQLFDAFTRETGIRVRFSIMPDESKLILANAAEFFRLRRNRHFVG